MFEVFDHTADLGLRIQAPDLNGLFAEAGRALLAVIVSNPNAVQPREQMSVRVDGEKPEYLFVDFLTELLFLFESKQFLASEFKIVSDERGLTATVRGETCDPDRHQ